MTSGIAFRLARAAVFAAVCVVTAALGHALMSGSGMAWWAVAYAFAATTAAAWWFTGRERGLASVTGATVVAQLGLHQLFALAQVTSASSTSASDTHVSMASMSTPSMSSMSATAMSSASMDMGHAHPVAPDPAGALLMGGDLGMFAAHLLAALVCGVWLWCGEAAAFRTGRAIAYRTGRLLGTALFEPLRRALCVSATVPPPVAPVRAGAFAPARRLRGVLLEYAVARRGPPVAPAVR